MVCRWQGIGLVWYWFVFAHGIVMVLVWSWHWMDFVYVRYWYSVDMVLVPNIGMPWLDDCLDISRVLNLYYLGFGIVLVWRILGIRMVMFCLYGVGMALIWYWYVSV